jgi:hypothetical protein
MLLANGDHSEIVAGRPAEQKQLICASQTAAHKTLSAPELPFSLCNIMNQEKERRVGFACGQNLNTYCFVPCGKQTSACISKAVMAT